MLVKQVELDGAENWWMNSSGEFIYKCNGNRKICWLDIDKRVKEGTILELKNIPGYWYVKKIYEIELEHKEINRTWHVGGL